MTEKELKVIESTKETWNAFLQLPEMHPDDQSDFRHHIHALQNIILSREGQRVLNAIELSDAANKLKNIPVPSFYKSKAERR